MVTNCDRWTDQSVKLLLDTLSYTLTHSITPIISNTHHICYYIYHQVTAMDHSIGLLLDTLRDLGIEENTIVVFTSDNGPENGAGA